jgi:hypothetical protein
VPERRTREQAAQDHLRGELATADYLTWSSTHLSFGFVNFKFFYAKCDINGLCNQEQDLCREGTIVISGY